MKTLLISLAGLTPQIITETIYYLTQLHNPSVDISEIYILTTSPGKEILVSSLLDSCDGKYFALLDDYNIDGSSIQFDASHIIVFKDAQGNELQDIRTSSDNEAVADQILDFVREKATNSDCRLHCSLAGGRKTMGLYLGFALQLYGRHGDVLSHVLVYPPELERDSTFFYPPPRSRSFQLQNGSTLESDQIKVELAEIPVLLLKDKIPLLQESTDLGYSELVRRTQEEFERLHSPLPLTINPTSRSLHIGEKISIHLTPLEFAIYLFVARRRLEGCDNPDCQGCKDCFCPPNEFSDEESLAELKNILQKIGACDHRYNLSKWKLVETERFREYRSSIKRKISKAAFGMSWIDLYTIAKLPSSSLGEYYYGIRLPKNLIQISYRQSINPV